MTIIFDTEPNVEKVVYSIQMFLPDVDKWTTIVDYKNEWDAQETYKEWTESSSTIYRMIAVTYKVDIIESEVPEFI